MLDSEDNRERVNTMRSFRFWVITMLLLAMMGLAGCGGYATRPEESAAQTPMEETMPDTAAAMEEMPADTTAAETPGEE